MKTSNTASGALFTSFFFLLKMVLVRHSQHYTPVGTNVRVVFSFAATATVLQLDSSVTCALTKLGVTNTPCRSGDNCTQKCS